MSGEFSSAILTAVYIPPHTDVKLAQNEPYSIIYSREIKHREGLVVVAGDFK